MTATVEPSNATNKKVTWKSSNPSVATVDENGKVKGLKEGKVTITVTTEDGSKTDTYEITVKSKYVLTLTAIKTETGVFQYRASVTKDGVKFASNNWKKITYNTFEGGLKIDSGNDTVPSQDVSTAVKTAKITLTSGEIDDATVVINN